jgi:hypothetical protein
MYGSPKPPGLFLLFGYIIDSLATDPKTKSQNFERRTVHFPRLGALNQLDKLLRQKRKSAASH